MLNGGLLLDFNVENDSIKFYKNEIKMNVPIVFLESACGGVAVILGLAPNAGEFHGHGC